MFLEMLLLKIRCNTIRFSSRLKRTVLEKENELTEEIEELENQENIVLYNTIKSKKTNYNK